MLVLDNNVVVGKTPVSALYPGIEVAILPSQ